MYVQSTIKMPPSHQSESVPVKQKDENSAEAIVIDLSNVGDVFESSVRMVGGTASAVVQSPRTILAPTLANFEPENRTTAEKIVAVGGGAATLGGIGFYLGTLSPYAQDKAIFGIAGAFLGGIAGFVASSHREKGLFDYTAIDTARSQAFQTASGNTARKNGAAFTEGYKKALSESFEDGANAVDSVGRAINSGFSFLDGAFRPGK